MGRAATKSKNWPKVLSKVCHFQRGRLQPKEGRKGVGRKEKGKEGWKEGEKTGKREGRKKDRQERKDEEKKG